MESFKQVREIFDLSRGFHQRLSEYYGRLASQAERQRAKMLLDYLSRHEANLQSCLERYEAEASNRILGVWCQYVPEAFSFDHLNASLANPAITVDEVTSLVLRLDDALIEFYRDLADNAESAEVRELFESLLQLAVSEEVALKREVAEF